MVYDVGAIRASLNIRSEATKALRIAGSAPNVLSMIDK
jgi:hypothetical protein